MKSRTNNVERAETSLLAKCRWCFLECSQPGLKSILTVQEKAAAIPLGLQDLNHKDYDHMENKCVSIIGLPRGLNWRIYKTLKTILAHIVLLLLFSH